MCVLGYSSGSSYNYSFFLLFSNPPSQIGSKSHHFRYRSLPDIAPCGREFILTRLQITRNYVRYEIWSRRFRVFSNLTLQSTLRCPVCCHISFSQQKSNYTKIYFDKPSLLFVSKALGRRLTFITSCSRINKL